MDDDTRYWLASDLADSKFQHNADSLLEITKKQAGKNPRNFITDGLPAYAKSSRKVFGKGTNHVKHIRLAGKRDSDDNKMERLNGEIRDREKVFRGLKKMDTAILDGMSLSFTVLSSTQLFKKMDTAILDGMRVYYNFTKKHGALDGQTPAESALISVDDANKWKTIIQNASLSKDSV